MSLGKMINSALSAATGYKLAKARTSVTSFSGWQYIRHNARRLEHLASLGLPLHGKKVLEVGAGIGDHSSFYLDRGCEMLITEARPENLEILRLRTIGAGSCAIGCGGSSSLIRAVGGRGCSFHHRVKAPVRA